MSLYTNLHTHTTRCHHAKGEDRAYVEAAIAAGVRVLGFADHSPMLFPRECGYYSGFRMHPEDFEEYVRSVTDLKREYAGEIAIHLGVELEYYPALFQDTISFLCQYPLEYTLMGQHYIHNEYERRDGYDYTWRPVSDPDYLHTYVEQVLEGLRTGAFTYLAHPDTVHFTGDEEVFRTEMSSLLRGAKELGIPMEVNFLGFREHRHYPRKDFWELVREIGNDVVLGLDAHSPDAFSMTGELEEMQMWVAALGLTPLRTVPLRDPHQVK